MTFEPHFNNTDESGLRIDINGFGKIDYKQIGNEYSDQIHFTESATYKKLEHEPDLEQ